MSGIALVQFGSPLTTMSHFILDNGLARLAACARAAGHDAVVLDFLTVDRVRSFDRARPPEEQSASFESDIEATVSAIEEAVASRKLGVVGFKLWSGEAYRCARETVRRLRVRQPNLTIIGGGPHVDYFGERILRNNPGFHLLVRGEGERPLVMLLDAIARGADPTGIPNLIYLDSGCVISTPPWTADDLDAWPFPDYSPEVYPAAAGPGKIRLAILETSRGCPYACSFCGHGRKSGRRTRSRRPERVVDEMESLGRDFGISRFRSGDSNTPPALSRGIGQEILRRKLKVSYTLMARADAARDYDLASLAQSGCRSVFFGLESGSAALLEPAFNKRLSPATALDAVHAGRDAGLFTLVSFIVPAPFETEETLETTFRFACDARPDAVTVCLPIINPGTAWGDDPGRFGIEIPPGYFERSVGFTPTLLYSVDRWQETPIRIGGRDMREMKRIAGEFEARLEGEGILTQVIDDVAMMAAAAGDTPRAFRDATRRMFDGGDRAGIAACIARINRGLASEEAGS